MATSKGSTVLPLGGADFADEVGGLLAFGVDFLRWGFVILCRRKSWRWRAVTVGLRVEGAAGVRSSLLTETSLARCDGLLISELDWAALPLPSCVGSGRPRIAMLLGHDSSPLLR